jgi:mannitol/fructose-specific phosphotransferase system IIA component (Ntr-type)
MKLSAFTDRCLVDLSVELRTRDEVIAGLVDTLARSPRLSDRRAFLDDVLKREALVTTGVGYGVAFPHAKSRAVRDVVFALGRTTEGIDFGALDGRPVRLVFLIGAPKQTEPSRIYLNLMARLSFLMKDEANRNLLLTTESVDEVLGLLDSVK